MSETTDEARSDSRSSQSPSHEESQGGDESPSRVKVTDKRMFRPDGELREEYSFLDQKTKPAPEGGQASDGQGARETKAETKTERKAERESPVVGASATAATPGRADTGAPREVPGYDASPEKVSFLNLLSVLAEPVAIYLGDVQLPDGRSAENLEMARLHIDLMDVLREKTRGNRTADETAILDDLLYRLRMRYVQKSGKVGPG